MVSFAVVPSPGQTFFHQPQLERLLGDDLLQRAGFLAQRLDLIGRGGAGRVARQAALAGLQELLRL